MSWRHFVSRSHCFHTWVTEGWNYLGDNLLFSFTVKLSRIAGIQDQKTKCCYCLYLEQCNSYGSSKMHKFKWHKVACYGTTVMILLYGVQKFQHSHFILNIFCKIKRRNNLNFPQIM